MYPCEMYVPADVRSHWLVVRTVPATFCPVTAQTRLTLAPEASEPRIVPEVDGAERRLTRPSKLLTVPTTYFLAAVVLTGFALTGTAVGEPVAQRGAVRDDDTYPCEMYRPLPSLSHTVVVRTEPLTF